MGLAVAQRADGGDARWPHRPLGLEPFLAQKAARPCGNERRIKGGEQGELDGDSGQSALFPCCCGQLRRGGRTGRSEEHTSALKSLLRISYAVFCLQKKQ